MAGAGALRGSPELAGAVGPPGRAEQQPRAATMSSVASYESLVHAVSGAVVSERTGAGRGARGPAGGAAVLAWRGARVPLFGRDGPGNRRGAWPGWRPERG